MASSTTQIPQDWFEMRDLARKRFANSVWVPIRAYETKQNADGSEETFCVGSVAFPPENRARAEQLGWSDLGLGHRACPHAFVGGGYKPADVFQYRDGEDFGLDLVLTQDFGGDERSLWHINQDLVMALRLKREGDVWLRPEEGYVEVIRERSRPDSDFSVIEKKSEYLREYLSARGIALRLSCYYERVANLGDASYLTWQEGGFQRDEGFNGRFECRISEVDEEGWPANSSVGVFHTWRTDVDESEDVPVFGPEDESNTGGRSGAFRRGGIVHYRVSGELWRDEWIEPAALSTRIRGDLANEIFYYITDAAGQRSSNFDLNNEDVGRYLWFDPKVIAAILSVRGAGLTWHSAETGSVWSSSGDTSHFGLNGIGALNVYAYDVAKLPHWQQKVWAGFNIAPEGGVSEELLAAQMRTRPASSTAPEALLLEALGSLDSEFVSWLGSSLFKTHEEEKSILRSLHRFRSTDRTGLLSIAKDVARLVADRADIGLLMKIVSPPKGEKWGSLKSIEKVLANFVSPDEARGALTPLVGIYKLRLGDAHLPSKEIDEAFRMAGIDVTRPFIFQAADLLRSAADALLRIREIVHSRP